MATNSYVQQRLERALSETGGDLAAAQERVLRDAVTDRKLLLGLVAPHIKPIVANAFSRLVPSALEGDGLLEASKTQRLSGAAKAGALASGARASGGKGTSKGSATGKVSRQRSGLTANDMDRVMDHLGAQIGTTAAPQGMTALITPPKRRKVTQTHADTMRELAKAYARQRFDPPED